MSSVAAGPAYAPSLLHVQDAPACDTACCECVWTCMRGRTRLACQLDADQNGQHRLTLLRNSRTYGQYAFGARDAALTFAARLRATFEGNGWEHC